MAHFDPNDMSRFAGFHILETTYKVVSDHEIACHVLIPKALFERAKHSPTDPRPILFRIHGGGFVSGSSLFPNFFAPWHLELATRHDAIIVSCDYRLAPEASIHDIVEDVEDFFSWIYTDLPSFVSNSANVNVYTTRIMTAGDSAGGYLSLLVGLNHSSEIRAVTASYPLVDAKSPHFTELYEKPMFGFPHLPVSLLRDHQASFVQNGGSGELFPSNKRDLHILEKLEDGGRFPRGGLFVWHGKGDTVVPVQGSVKLSEKIGEVNPDLPFTLAIQEGDHGFDEKSSIDEPWMQEGLKGLVAAWLA
ncbi:Alpha/Beta hydrolase protein [Fusarium solani]|uniref:Alpha/Beta hydrolase protein n=1 Tax=Fusarium solani TaxID=169388 RepID=A0A9P9GM74_FUSSL|nr:Alpha/Beta hydrolase protein [Fusarium solani]KAH7240442.1 Alpha/Beta hydrolase protein [Fusarium solani]